MILGIISDTHGNKKNTIKALDIFTRESIKTILHAGDFGSRELLTLFDQFEIHLAYGNTDSETDLPKTLFKAQNQPWPEKEQKLEFAGKKILLLHGDHSPNLQEKIKSGKYDYIIKGHTHFPEDYRFQHTRVLNPGALHRADTYSVGILDLINDEWRVLPVC